jgi:DNA-binding NarL/FixJ family response regulator
MDHLTSEVDQSTPTQQQPKPQLKREHIEWRRSQVLELSSQGRTAREIAIILRVGAATVGRDFVYLRKQAQYQKCLNGLTQVLR